jgi:leader peptidase (prepilin peptidase)/N-methyltransferase
MAFLGKSKKKGPETAPRPVRRQAHILTQRFGFSAMASPKRGNGARAWLKFVYTSATRIKRLVSRRFPESQLIMPAPFDNPLAVAIICGVFGLMIGSFLNVVIYRLPVGMKRGWAKDASEFLADTEIQDALALSGEDRSVLADSARRVESALAQLPRLTLSRPRSACPHCGHKISALENIPLVSYLALRGRCRGCKAHISLRYPLVELTVGLLFAAAGWHFGATPQLIDGLILIGLLCSMTLIDADTMLLPDSLTLPLLWLGLIASAASLGFVTLQDSLIGAVAGYSIFWMLANAFRVLRGVEGMGGGDFKLLAALGAWFGWSALLPIVLLSAGVGSVVGLTLLATKRATMLSRLPFGVYLAPAGLLMLFFGKQLIALVMPGGD